MESDKRNFSLEKAKVIMTRHGVSYSDHELETIIDFLYKMAAIEYKVYERRQQEKRQCDPEKNG